MGVRVCTETDCGQCARLWASFSVLVSNFGTCVQLLSPLIFCLVSVLSGICAQWNGAPTSEEPQTTENTNTDFVLDTKVGRL